MYDYTIKTTPKVLRIPNRTTPEQKVLRIPNRTTPEQISDDLVKNGCVQGHPKTGAPSWYEGNLTVLKEAQVVVIVGANDCLDPNVLEIASTTRRTFVFEPALAYEKCLSRSVSRCASIDLHQPHA